MTNKSSSSENDIMLSCSENDSESSCSESNKDCFISEKMLYHIGAWADNRVTEIEFLPKNGIPIKWTTPVTLVPSNPTNINHWNMQTPITQPSFPIFPLKIICGDKIIFKFDNDIGSPNAFACAANIDGIIYRTSNNNLYPNKINLKSTTGFSIVNPSYIPTTDLVTRNIIDSINYISVSPNSSSKYTLIWEL